MSNVIIGQSGGPTAVINSSLAGAIRAAKDHGIKKVYGMHHGIEGFLNDDVIDLDIYFDDLYELSLLKRTPSAFLGSCRYKLPEIEGNEDTYEKMFLLMEKYDIEYFLYIGGNDSMDTIKQLSDYAAMHGKDQKFIGIPKTIDNDLPVTDHTPGYGSASKFIATTMKEIIRDNESFGASEPKLCVVEIMGRNAGWLTASSMLADDPDCNGPDLIYLPEVAFDPEAFIHRVHDLCLIKKSIVIAISEGIQLADGTLVCELGNDATFVDAFGHRNLTGTARYLCNEIAKNMDTRVRSVELSTLQRCAGHLTSRTDITEAYQVGGAAAKAAFEGTSGKMVALKRLSDEPYQCTTELVDIEKVANYEKKIPLEWINSYRTDMTQEFLTYARPLIQAELTPFFIAGLPRHIVNHG